MEQLADIHAQAAEEKSDLMRRSTVLTLLGVGTMIALKASAWLMTGSVSLLSSLVDSVMDLFASTLNFFAVRYALTPPDAEHRFGHGKVEYIAGMGQALFISVTAIVVIAEAVSRFITPVEVEHGMVGIAVMAISIVITLAMVAYQKEAVRETGSTAVKADSVHYVMDVLANAAVIGSLILSTLFGWTWVDPLAAIGISLYILHGAWEVGYTSFQNLMDREFEDEERLEIERVILSHECVQGVHELKTRRSGLLSFIQFHIDIDAQLSLKDAHDIAEEVEDAVQKLHPHAEVLVHMDPV